MKPLSLAQYILIGLALVGLGLLAYFSLQLRQNQHPQEPVRIGIIQYLNLLNPVIEGFQQEMARTGYEDGNTVVYLLQSAEGDKERLAEIARFYISQDVDMIYAVTSVAANAALRETTSQGREDIPIVYAHADNPIETGLAKDLKQPQTNATGVAVDLRELTAKKLEFLGEINPQMRRVGIFTAEYSDFAGELVVAELRQQAPNFGLELVEYRLSSAPGIASTQELAQLANEIQTGQIHALFQTPGPVLNQTENVQLFINLAKRLGIPTVFVSTPQVEMGGLFAYSHDFFAVGRQSAHIAQKVLQGQAPQTIPIEFAQDNILAINFQTAQEIGIHIPESMLTLVTVEFGIK